MKLSHAHRYGSVIHVRSWMPRTNSDSADDGTAPLPSSAHVAPDSQRLFSRCINSGIGNKVYHVLQPKLRGLGVEEADQTNLNRLTLTLRSRAH